VKSIGSVVGVFWAVALGVVALFVFFAATGGIAPGDVEWLTAAVGALALLASIYFARVRHALDDHRHGELARSVHAMRERRGF
jgi:membrane protein implicated in regulation of membrane protease activity